MPVNHDRPSLLRRGPLALGAAALLGLGGGLFAVTHAGASAPAAVVHSATLTQATSPAPSGAAAPSTTSDPSAAAEPAETPGAPETGTAAEPAGAPETDGPGGWADPAGSTGAVDQQGEN
ncbi:MAG TPA: hypothetical protein VGQ42_00655 [Candidatus Dormibacteraeota bacterium]|jgi:hypothetical protein|nr:hypothetical protein [Candidatus Dormibacteraeota bacterium]